MNWSPVSIRHLERLTDDTGLMEHALGVIPRRQEGYSTDDQARGIWACIEWLELAEASVRPRLLELLDVYLSFLLGVQREDGHFHNNITFDRSREEERPSDDCLGRCLWALTLAIDKLPEGGRRLAAEAMLKKALTRVPDMTSPRGWAYALASASLLYQQSSATTLHSLLVRLSTRLLANYRSFSNPEWRWFEPVLAYSNGLLPWGLLCAYEVLKQEELLHVSLDSLDFLISKSTGEHGRIRPIGNQGWCTPESRAMWDQQPIDVFKLALACAKAFLLTEEPRFADMVDRCRAWYYGDNDAGVSMVDAMEGACFDGIARDGPNLNCGAESTLSYLLMETVYRKYAGKRPELPQLAAGLR